MSKILNKKNLINCNGQLLDLSTPKVMGILNVTPDSFYDGGKHADQILKHTAQMLSDGADIIDIGAYSSRPGAAEVSVKEEKERLNKALDIVRSKYPDAILSVDTFRAEIAQYVVENYHVDIINDIAAGDLDKDMFDVMAQLQVPYIMMHMKGNPQIMQQMAQYDDVVTEVIQYFAEKVSVLKEKGLHDVIIDPGFGFGKTIEHNYEIISRLQEFAIFELPLLVGVSRKSMIYKPLQITAEQALNGTSILNTIALQKGANILRVHDVKEAVECVKIMNLVG
ncbi:dihydropteroate synthase [Saccharicrinis aurantiacus]|uniref:dihydropteroate synthase n=1 Tax=Saccharicrinis aurantiacus TaxID=1849719 RepID=UPI00249397C3|nr:dihydropteroate synthase [Saccharicrinis aurantiacus]